MNVQISIASIWACGGNFNPIYLSIIELDFGDAPESGTAFRTLASSNGAGHAVTTWRIGSTIDGEADGHPSADAMGDGSDQDGVAFEV